MKNLLYLISIFIILSVHSLSQDTIHVPDDYTTIQAAIDATSNSDVVLVAEGTYYENLQITSKSITLGSHFMIDEDTSHISRTIIDGSQPLNPDLASVISVSWSAEPTVICGFRITGGLGTKPPSTGELRVGGGIIAARSNITITDNQIINNSLIANDGAAGAGIIIRSFEYDSLWIIIRNNLIADNYAESEMTGGGGIAITDDYHNNINYLIENNIIRGNIVQNTDEWKAMGGGIALDFYLPTNGSQIIRNNIITGNEARCQNSFGGGMYIVLSESISDGSVDNDPGPYIYNNIISDNHSDYLGGAVSVWRAYFPFGSEIAYPLTSWGHYTPKPSFVNNTIVDNTAEDGAGFYIMNHIPFLMNNILWNDYPSNAEWGEIFLGDDSTWTAWVEPNNYGGAKMFYNDIQDGWAPDSGEGNINFDPMFEDTLLNLSDSSYCVGNGTDSIEVNGIYYTFSSIDFNGNVRPNPIDSYIDIGAKESPYERNQIPIGVKDNSNELPVKYSLQQNYPNPFNPSTIISWQSPVGSHQTLKIFDVLGNEIATLVDEYKPAGRYEVEFNAEKLSSGIYFYQLRDGEYVNTKKMILLK
jgi:hypothetical protein